MIATNRAVAHALDAAKVPSIRRVVKAPERWAKIVAYALERGVKLPETPSSVELSKFVEKMRTERANEFADISLAIVKLMGRGEYVAHQPGQKEVGHFGLATSEYTHSTAPNRRFCDLVTQRIVKRLAEGHGQAYSFDELAQIAPIYFVLGNHDYYRSSIAAVRGAVERLPTEMTWLPACGPLKITPRTTILGVDGWGDARCGDLTSKVQLSDWMLIDDFKRGNRIETLQRLGANEARRLREHLAAAPESEHLLEGRWYGQAPGIDGVTYLADGRVPAGSLVRARVTQASDYDLAASLEL